MRLLRHRPTAVAGPDGLDGIDSDVAAIRAVARPGDVIGTYYDGTYAWSAAQLALFPDCYLLRISVMADPAADTFDCEPGNAPPAAVAGAVATKHGQGDRSLVYCATDNAGSPYDYAAVVAACQTAGVGVAGWDWWAPDWTGAPHLVPLSVATQYASLPSYDESWFSSSWIAARFNIDPPPPPAPLVYQGDHMKAYNLSVKIGSGWGWLPLPVPSSQVVSVTVDVQSPPDTGSYNSNVPRFVGLAGQPAKVAPNGVAQFAGPVDGTFGVVVWTVG